MQNSYSSYSNAKYTPRVSLIILTVKKIEHEDLILFYLLYVFLFTHAQLKNCMVYMNNLHTDHFTIRDISF